MSITDFTHVVETLMDELPAGRRSFDETLQSLLLSSVDCIRLLLTAVQANTECKDPQIDRICRKLQSELIPRTSLLADISLTNQKANIAFCSDAIENERHEVLESVNHDLAEQCQHSPEFAGNSQSEIKSIRVGIDKIDGLDNRVGELVNMHRCWGRRVLG